eukprot:12722563-Alexandrium_andersonii.AAC.1
MPINSRESRHHCLEPRRREASFSLVRATYARNVRCSTLLQRSAASPKRSVPAAAALDRTASLHSSVSQGIFQMLDAPTPSNGSWSCVRLEEHLEVLWTATQN